MIVAAVDIGTNSMRLLITDGSRDLHREVEVTGLGVGVDGAGHFDEERVAATLRVLDRYGGVMDRFGVDRRRAVATSATRDAADGAAFVEKARRALGVQPEIIDGRGEAELSFRGARMRQRDCHSAVVIDIGGGSTEFVYGSDIVDYATSVDLGSVRLTDRELTARPASDVQVQSARAVASRAFANVHLPEHPECAIGVAGTFTSLAAIMLGLEAYDRDRVDGSVLRVEDLEALVEDLAPRTL
ncbi:MAG: exopolyphosphatase, partial [Actinomycetota bacterium]